MAAPCVSIFVDGSEDKPRARDHQKFTFLGNMFPKMNQCTINQWMKKLAVTRVDKEWDLFQRTPNSTFIS